MEWAPVFRTILRILILVECQKMNVHSPAFASMGSVCLADISRQVLRVELLIPQIYVMLKITAMVQGNALRKLRLKVQFVARLGRIRVTLMRFAMELLCTVLVIPSNQ
jgi:hypothetical protein